MPAIIKHIREDESGTDWVEVSGPAFEFKGVELFGFTEDGRILDCHGCALTDSDPWAQALKEARDLARSAQYMTRARMVLGWSQATLADNLAWSVKQVSNIETATRPMKMQTELAIECLLRREGEWVAFNKLEPSE